MESNTYIVQKWHAGDLEGKVKGKAERAKAETSNS